MNGWVLSRRQLVLGLLASSTAACAAPGDEGRPATVSPPEPAAPWEHTGPVTTATLLPYGTAFAFDSGAAVVLERVAGPTVVLAQDGLVAFADPLVLEPGDLGVRLPAGPQPTEFGIFGFAKPGRPGESIRRVAVMALGQVELVTRWRIVTRGGGIQRFWVDGGVGLAYSASHRVALSELINLDDYLEVMGPLIDASAAVLPFEVDGEVAAVGFDCGKGDGAYPVYAGEDATGKVRAVAADLELLHDGTPS